MSVRKIPVMADVTKIAVRIIRYNHCERYGLRYETSDEIINDAAQIGVYVVRSALKREIIPDVYAGFENNAPLIQALDSLQRGNKRHSVSRRFRAMEDNRQQQAFYYNVKRYEDSVDSLLAQQARAYRGLKFAIARSDRTPRNIAYWAERFSALERERRVEMLARMNYPDYVLYDLLGND